MYDISRPSTRIGGHDSPLEVEAKRAMIQAFEAMPSASKEQLDGLWEAVRGADTVLVSETSRKIREFESARRGNGAT